MKIRSLLKKLQGGGFSHESSVPNRGCREFEVNNWIISQFVVDRLVQIVGVHPFPINEQMLMVAAICRLRPTHIFEWGTNIGKSARIFYETCRGFGIAAEVHSVDLPDEVEHAEHPGEKRGHLVRGIPGVQLHLGDGLDTSLQILATCGAAEVRPLFFLDGDHGYASVRRELEGIIEQVPLAGILLHDTFYQSEQSGYNVGPYRALVDVLADNEGTFKILSQNIGLPGMTLLWQAP